MMQLFITTKSITVLPYIMRQCYIFPLVGWLWQTWLSEVPQVLWCERLWVHCETWWRAVYPNVLVSTSCPHILPRKPSYHVPWHKGLLDTAWYKSDMAGGPKVHVPRCNTVPIFTLLHSQQCLYVQSCIADFKITCGQFPCVYLQWLTTNALGRYCTSSSQPDFFLLLFFPTSYKWQPHPL